MLFIQNLWGQKNISFIYLKITPNKTEYYLNLKIGLILLNWGLYGEATINTGMREQGEGCGVRHYRRGKMLNKVFGKS